MNNAASGKDCSGCLKDCDSLRYDYTVKQEPIDLYEECSSLKSPMRHMAYLRRMNHYMDFQQGIGISIH